MSMKPATHLKATHLLLDIQKHFANGGGALSMRDISRMVGLSSSAAAQQYVDILERWGAIQHIPKGVRTIVLTKPDAHYPPVEWRKDLRKATP